MFKKHLYIIPKIFNRYRNVSKECNVILANHEHNEQIISINQLNAN